MTKYLKVIGKGTLVIFGFLFIILAFSDVFQNMLTSRGRIFVYIVACNNFILSTKYFVNELCVLRR